MTLIFSLIFLISSVVSAVVASDYGFAVELIHRDSPKSPMHNPSETHFHRLTNSLRRSFRHNTTMLADTTKAPLFGDGGEYIMKLSIGTPPFSIVAIADTGSDIIWTQCEPCPNCYKQNAPMFNPSKSPTYKKVACSSPICQFAGSGSSCSADAKCHYTITYGDRSHSEGDMAVDTVTLESTSGHPVAFPRIAIGCGHDNTGNFDANVSGIVGLGHGSASLVSQMGPASDGKFSYCLASFGTFESNTLNFGSNANVSGEGSVSTPIYISEKFKTFYSLNLQAMSVGDNKIEFPTSSILANGSSIIIDSGTTLTLVPPAFYTNFATAIADKISLQPADDPSQFLQHCFKSTSDDFKAPSITANFEGADVSLRHENVFIRVAENIVCLAFGPGDNGGFSIYGNIAQTNFLVGYDVKKMTVSFKPTNCSSK